MWFKKKAYINGYNSNTAVDDTDWRTSGNNNAWSVSYTLPSAADANKYFYLPALGYYSSGRLAGVGNYGYYWSSSTDPWSTSTGYNLFIRGGGINVGTDNRDNGFRVGRFE